MSDESSPKNEPAQSEASGKRRRTMRTAGVAFGIGSAAIVAALLYANRNRRSDRGNKD